MIVINPGSGPVAGANQCNAIENIYQFITDLKNPRIQWTRLPNLDGDGRYGFLLWQSNRCHEVLMPGLPLEKVRFMEIEGQNIWHFPRLYVDGDSWVWKFALNNCFRSEEDEQ